MEEARDFVNFYHELKILDENKDGKKFKVSVKVPFNAGWVENMNFMIFTQKDKKTFKMDFIKIENEYSFFEVEVFLDICAIYHYCFYCELSGNFVYYKKSNLSGNNNISDKECWKLSVGFETPEWAKGAIMYHIFVDRYRKGKDYNFSLLPNRIIHEDWKELPYIGFDENGRWNTDFFCGNLKGIEETLDYIKKLGVTIIYLSPIVKSQSNHRYDTADYEEVDTYAGTNEILKELCKKAHQKNMYVVLDAVFNHTGNDSKYFNEYGTYDNIGAFQSEESPYYSFYRKDLSKEESKFSYWWGMKNLPECDGNSEEWKNYILSENGIIDKWFNLGIDGLRLDVADELTDEFIEGIRIAVHRNKKDGFVIGEVWKNPMRMNREYISSGKCMDSVMNYMLVDGLIRYYKYSNIDSLSSILEEINTEYPEETIHTLMNFTSTHDISRLIEICGCNCFNEYSEWAWNLENDDFNFVKEHKITKQEYKKGKNILKSYITALAFMPGIFSIFYGDEVGLKGVGNLMNRSTYPWGERDKDLLNFFRTIGSIRKNNAFLKCADLNLISITDSVLMFERISEDEKILVATSRTNEKIDIQIPEEYLDGEVIYSLNKSDKKYLNSYGVIIVKNYKIDNYIIQR